MLARKIKDRIASQGPIPFSEYMDLCLFDPEHGYYTNLKEMGRRGDFVTAPECGPYFAKALAHFLEPKVQVFKNPVIFELGGGSGQLAFDLLSFLAIPVRYIILEKSPSLKAIQQQKLAGLSVEWVDDVLEQGLEGVILANEFFDALPVERYTEAGQSYVDYQEGQFFETGEGQRFEKCLLFKEILSPILGAFKQGLALVIDYGDEVIDHSTLTAYKNHQIVSVFDSPGDCDITAHVNFTDLAEIFIQNAWEIDAFKTQAEFSLEQGILPERGLDTENYAIKRLIDPRLMGRLFKVMSAQLT